MLSVLLLLSFLSALLTILGKYRGPLWLIYLFKPLAMVFILTIAIRAAIGNWELYQISLVVGLLFSLAGDVFLMLPSDRFLPGLVSFLVAHVFYIVAFTSVDGFAFSWLFLPYLLYGVIMVYVLWPHLGKMCGPVLLYMIVILVMGWQAGELWHQARDEWRLLVAIGALLFLLSDSTLALNRFRRPFAAAEAIKLSTYFAAQALLALSLSWVA